MRRLRLNQRSGVFRLPGGLINAMQTLCPRPRRLIVDFGGWSTEQKLCILMLGIFCVCRDKGVVDNVLGIFTR